MGQTGPAPVLLGGNGTELKCSGPVPPGGPDLKALKFGQKIGARLNFEVGGPGGLTLGLIFASVLTGGNFHNESNRFLGLQLESGGTTHYRWARVNVKAVNKNFVFELVDYAYQSTPDTPIRAGEGIPVAEVDFRDSSMAAAKADLSASLALSILSSDRRLPATLGLLAYGADAIPAWRR